MIRRQVQLDWHVGEETYQDEAHVARTSRGRANERSEGWLAVHLLRGLVLLLLSSVMLSAHTPSPAQREQMRIRAGVEQTLMREAVAWQRSDRDLADSLVDEGVDGRWRRAWRAFWATSPEPRQDFGAHILHVQPLAPHEHQHGESSVARVEVLITRPSTEWWISSPHRETRFYRESADGWLRTLPAAAYWGSPQILDTAHFRFEYHSRDAASVAAIAPQVNAIYVSLHKILRQEPPDRPVTVAIVPDRVRGSATRGDHLVFASPAFAKVPAALSAADYLAHQIVSQLVYDVVNEAATHQRNLYQYRWERVTWALRGWLRTELLDQRTPWHDQADALFRAELADGKPLRLRDVNQWRRFDRPDQAELMGQYVAAESVIAYAMATHGVEMLPELLHGFGRHGTWGELIPALFDMSVAEFEREWNRYVTETYGTEPSAPD